MEFIEVEALRETIKRIGYNSSDIGFDFHTCAVMTTYDKQSPDIAQGVNEGEGLDLDQGAGDQGRHRQAGDHPHHRSVRKHAATDPRSAPFD